LKLASLVSWLPLWLLLAAPARAATVALPEGEPVEPWVEPLAQAGLRLVRPGEAADLAMSAEGGRWVLRSASAQATGLRPPVTEEQREDIALLLASLARPAEHLDWGIVGPARPPPQAPRPEAPTAKKRPVTPVRPRIERESPAPVEAAPRAPDPVSLDPLPALLVPVAMPGPRSVTSGITSATRDMTHPWAEAGALAQRRLDLSGSYGLSLGGGLARGPLRAGLRWQHPGEADLAALGEERRVTVDTGQLGLWFSPTPWVAVGAGGGLSRRVYSQEGEEVDRELIPALWLEGRLEPRLGPGLRLGLSLSAARDLRATELWVGDAPQGELSSWSLSGGLGLMWAPGDQDRAPRPRKG